MHSVHCTVHTHTHTTHSPTLMVFRILICAHCTHISIMHFWRSWINFQFERLNWSIILWVGIVRASAKDIWFVRPLWCCYTVVEWWWWWECLVCAAQYALRRCGVTITFPLFFIISNTRPNFQQQTNDHRWLWQMPFNHYKLVNTFYFSFFTIEMVGCFF